MSVPSPASRLARSWPLALLSLAVLVYWPGLAGPFVFDDYPNLVLPLQDAMPRWEDLRAFVLSGESGPLGRPLTLLSFAFNFAASGLSPFAFKATNLALHLLNAGLVFALVRALSVHLPQLQVATRDLACVTVTALWVLHPVHLTSVLYVVQRMTSLSSAFVLLGVLFYLRARQSQLETGRLAGWSLGAVVPLCLLAATLAKESGVLLLAYLTALEVSLLRFRTRTPGQARALSLFFTIFLIVPLLLAAAFLFARPGYLQGEELVRGFTLAERALTETRVLWFYLQLLLLPEISELGLYHDDFLLSSGLLSPATTLPALLGWGLVLAAALLRRGRNPLLALAVTWYLAGHALESTVLMLQPVQLHRNYLAMLGPLIAVVVMLGRWAGPAGARWVRVLFLLWALTLAGVTAVRAGQWRSALDVAVFEVVHHPQSPRANYDVARVLAEIALARKQPALLEEAHRYFRRAAALEPSGIGALLAIWTSSSAPLPDEDYRTLLARLERRPVFGPDVAFLRKWIDCPKRTNCVLPPTLVLPVFETLLKQPTMGAEARANVLVLLALYRADRLGDLAGAIELLEQSVREQPLDPVYQLNLAQAYLFLPDYDRAGAALVAAERLDRLGRQRSRLQTLRADLAAFKARSPLPGPGTP